MAYDAYSYLWPPRPEVKIPVGAIGFYQQRGFWAQKKKNGTCTVIFARGDEVIFKTRHNDDHKLWTPKAEHKRFFANKGGWDVFVAELLHSKTPHIKDQLYIFDQLVSNGQQLTGSTFGERQEALLRRWKPLNDESDQLRVAPHVSVAKPYKAGFVELFKTLAPEDEGLVFKNPKATLEACYKPTSNAGWQAKCRIPHKNYSF